MEKYKAIILDWLEENKSQYTRMADQIWEKPEIYWEEVFASGLQADYLESEEFAVTRGPAGMPTAFIAEWGSGSPILAFIGEYDALPGLSQEAQPFQKPVVEGGSGQGCGHHILGVAGVAASVAVKKWMQANDIVGTVRYYGTPAEEMGGGKVFMARDGLFGDLDAALTYHPGFINMASKAATVAIVSSSFLFHGRSAHAGGAPHLGRSALDAVELMNVGANYLREHVLDGTRIHYVITNGGQAANIVPETAEVHYILRAEKPDYLLEVAERLRNIARGAALMTDTTYKEIVESGYASMLPNNILADLMFTILEKIGPIHYTNDELAFAQQINDSFNKKNTDYIEQRIDTLGMKKEFADMLRAHADQPLLGANFPALDEGIVYKGATDVGDLSQVVPTGALDTTCFPTCSPGHSWVNTACGGMSIGHKGLMHAAKTLALTAAALFEDEETLKKARIEFEQRMAGKTYTPLIPEDMQPPK
ncbi:MAG: amidohydrolase [Pelolinea sp.]|nr:amidohydrolase [Pelolinea sp.]